MTTPWLSIIIVNWNTADLLEHCLTSVQDSMLQNIEIIVVDNASTDDSICRLRKNFPYVQVIPNTANVGFAAANNIGWEASSGTFLLFLNSDTIVPKNTLTELVTFLDNHPDVGAVSPQLRRSDGEPQDFSFGNDPTPAYLLKRGVWHLLCQKPLHNWHTSAVQQVDWISGACLLTRRNALETIGGWDEQMFMYFEDSDLCFRLRQAGWKIVFYPKVFITHIGGQSVQKNPVAQSVYYQSLMYFYRKHYSWGQYLLLKLMLPIYRRMT